MRAVWPRISLSCVVSARPGTWTRMRSLPSAWIDGSVVPSAFTRRSSTCTLWVTAERSRVSMPSSVSEAVMRPAVFAELDLADRPLPEQARLDRRRERLERGQRGGSVRRIGEGQRHRLAARIEAAKVDARVAQASAGYRLPACRRGRRSGSRDRPRAGDVRRLGGRVPAPSAASAGNDGHEATVSAEKKFGMVAMMPKAQTRRMSATFQR